MRDRDKVIDNPATQVCPESLVSLLATRAANQLFALKDKVSSSLHNA